MRVRLVKLVILKYVVVLAKYKAYFYPKCVKFLSLVGIIVVSVYATRKSSSELVPAVFCGN